jgi:SAM-dependent methyltransferase
MDEFVYNNANQKIFLDLGCGKIKKSGYIGVDKFSIPEVDYVVDFEKENLPFKDDSVVNVYSSHCLEHLSDPHKLLSELIRVCTNNASFELWLPHLRSNDAFVFDHRMFYNELIISRISGINTDFWFPDNKGALRLNSVVYIIDQQIESMLDSLNVPLHFAIKHWFNIIKEWGMFFTIVKEPDYTGHSNYKTSMKEPKIYFTTDRNNPFSLLETPPGWWEIR